MRVYTIRLLISSRG